MRQQLELEQSTAPVELAADPPAVELRSSIGEALGQARSEDRRWRIDRHEKHQARMRAAVRLGLQAAALGPLAGYFAILTLLAGLLLVGFAPPLGGVVLLLSLLSLAVSALSFFVSWLIYVGLGLASRRAKRDAIIDQLPSRRPLLWPGKPREK